MVGLREVSRQLKQAQEGIKACAAAASQGKVKQVREVTQELSTCMKELARLTGEARGRLGAGLSSFSMVHGSSGEELPLSQEIPLQGHTHHQAPPPSVHAHQSRGGTPVPQPTPPVAHPPAPSEPGPPSRTASGPTLPVLAVVQAPMTVTAPPPVVPHSVTACLSATAGLLGPDTSATNTSSSGGGAPVAQGGGAHIAQGRHRAASPKAGALPGEEGSRSRSADFAETVPLQVLLREGLLCPGLGCLSTGIMVRSHLPPCMPAHSCTHSSAHSCPMHRESSLLPPSVRMAACPCPPDRSFHSRTSGSMPAGRRSDTGASGPRRARPTRW